MAHIERTSTSNTGIKSYLISRLTTIPGILKDIISKMHSLYLPYYISKKSIYGHRLIKNNVPDRPCKTLVHLCILVLL